MIDHWQGALRLHLLNLLWTWLWEHMLPPRHSVHVLVMQLCSHICDPPHSLHRRLWGGSVHGIFSCSQCNFTLLKLAHYSSACPQVQGAMFHGSDIQA